MIIVTLVSIVILCYACYRWLAREIEVAITVRQYRLTASADQISAAFRDAVARFGWALVDSARTGYPGEIIAASPQGGIRPRIVCEVGPDSAGAREVRIGLNGDSIDNIGRSSALGGMTGAFLEARTIRHRQNAFEARLNELDPQLLRLEPHQE